MARPMRTVSFKLPEGLDEALTGLARRGRATRSALVRQAIESLTRGTGGSVTALALDLAGSIEGPADLSVAKRRLSDYGR